MPSYTLDELLKKMEPQAHMDKALIARCIDGLGLYTAQIAAENSHSDKIKETRKLVETLVGYWGINDGTNAKPLEDFLDAFDERVYDARAGGAVTGDVFQAANNVIYGLYRYGEDMVTGQGADAMGEILDMSDLIKDIAQAWDYEPDIAADLTGRLETEVRDMLDNITLPGQVMSGIKNAGYELTQAVLFDNDGGIALAHHPNAPAPFVTWQFNNENGVFNHYWGHYYGKEDRALIDYITRTADYQRSYKLTEKPIPTAAIEADAEQNYNMIDGVKNNEGEPKPDLTDGQTYAEICELAPETLPEEKASVLDQIRAAREVPKQPRERGPEPEKKKTGFEL
jgi:hypothetical protein